MKLRPNLADTDRMQTFTAASMSEALALVKRTLGPEAVILGTRSIEPGGLRGLVGGRRVEITAAPGTVAPPPPRDRAPETSHGAASTTRARDPRAATGATVEMSDIVHPYYLELVQNEVAEELAAKLVRSAATRGETIEAALRDCIAALVPKTGGINLTPGVPRRVAFVGPSGSGKTTTIAKLAARFQLREGRRVALVTLDTRRIDAAAQLRRYGEIIGVAVHSVTTAEDVPGALAAVGDAEVVLIDTPGIGMRDRTGHDELARRLRLLGAHETHLVIPASQSPRTHERLAAAFSPLGISHMVLTKLDDAAGFGVVLSVMQKLHWRLSYLSHGQSVPADLIPACSRHVAELIFPPRATGSSPAGSFSERRSR